MCSKERDTKRERRVQHERETERKIDEIRNKKKPKTEKFRARVFLTCILFLGLAHSHSLSIFFFFLAVYKLQTNENVACRYILSLHRLYCIGPQ